MDAFLAWAALRLRETTTWVGLGIIAVSFGSDPMQAASLVQAMSLVLGGGLVTFGPTPGVAGNPKAEEAGGGAD